MNKRPGHVTVTTEVGVCSFCGRPRNLRREDHQLGTLVRTIVTCETCHRTLSSSMGVASAESEAAAAPAEVAAPVKDEAPPAAKPKRAPAKRATAAKKSAAAAKPKTAARAATRKK
jgi:hypothetical protein